MRPRAARPRRRPASPPSAAASPAGAATAPARRVRGHLPGARAYRACAAAGDFWPTMVLARAGAATWVACKEDNRRGLARRRAGRPRRPADRRARRVRRAVGARRERHALQDRGRARGGDARPRGRRAVQPVGGRRVAVGGRRSRAARSSAIDPAGEIVTKVAVGDGPADIAFAGTTAWIVNHRDRALVALDTRTNQARKVATLDAEVPERIAVLGGDLWITGRGTDLLRVDTARARQADDRDRRQRHRRGRRRRPARRPEPQRGGRPDRAADDGRAADRHSGRRASRASTRPIASTSTGCSPSAGTPGWPTRPTGSSTAPELLCIADLATQWTSARVPAHVRVHASATGRSGEPDHLPEPGAGTRAR